MQLIVQSGNLAGQVYTLEGRSVHIGRNPAAAIRIDDARASRNHAIIEPNENGGYTCRDLQSTNKTFVNGKAISSTDLDEGDVIRIGSTEIVFDGAATGSFARNEIAMKVDTDSLEIAIRSSSEIETGTLGIQEALFRLGHLKDPSKSQNEFLEDAMEILAACVSYQTWAWVDWPQGTLAQYRVRGFRDGKELGDGDLSPNESLIERAVKRRTGLIGSAKDSVRIPANSDAQISTLAVPLFDGENLAAVLFLDRMFSGQMPPFTRVELEHVAAFASLLHVDLKNLVLYDRLEQAFEDLRRSQEDLVQTEKMAAVGRLVGAFAHDLNNPLSSILGFIELAQRTVEAQPDDEILAKLGRFLSRAHDGADYCRALSRNLLAFARQENQEDGVRHEFDAAQTVEATLNICFSAIQKSNAEVSVEIPEGVTMIGDPSTLQQVVMNLVTNAADALSDMKSGHKGVITVKGTATPDGLNLSVSDNGPGIPAEIRKRIFEPLFTTKNAGRGTGLGLFVVRKIVEESGGNIAIQSDDDGTTFTVCLPREVQAIKSKQGHSQTATMINIAVHDLELEDLSG